MDLVMLGVTGGALVLAVVMSIVAVKILRTERRRSAARVAELEIGAADDVMYDEEFDGAEEFGSAGEFGSESEAGFGDAEIEPARDEQWADEFRDRRPQIAAVGTTATVTGPMFAATEEPKAPARRWLALAAVGIVMAMVVAAGYALFKPAALNASSIGAENSAPGPAVASVPANAQPIQLLSLKHSIDGENFSVTGLVQNPLTGAAISHVVAVVYVFDKDGTFLASGKSDVEFTGLRSGEESPFVVRIPNVAPVGRYRVGFRREDGSVIAHVDKRGEQTAGLMTEGR